MSVRERYKIIEGEECLIHLPARPNGYAVLILGDRNHYVEDHSSYWLQHASRRLLLMNLLDKGYTVFYSNHGKAHWGNDHAYQVTERLINFVLKSEIVNEKIHMIAEGQGALLAIKLMNHSFVNIRSVILINPCLNLLLHYEEEKNNRFFFKQFINEMREAYGIKEDEVQETCRLNVMELIDIRKEVPIKVFQAIYHAPYSPDNHIRPFIKQQKDKQLELNTTFYFPGKTINQFSTIILAFLRKYESMLFYRE